MALKLGKCRLCLKLGDFYSIFTVDNAVQLAEMVMECARIKVFEGDGLPDKICSECIQKLSSAYIFKQQCERSDQELRRNYVPPPGFSDTPPSTNRQSSDSAFSGHTEHSGQVKPSSSTDSKTTPNRKRSHGSIDNVSVTSRSHDRPSSTKRVEELRKSQKRARLNSENTDSDFDYSASQFSAETDSDEPLLRTDYKCEKCDRSFKSVKSRSAHMKTHSGGKASLGENAVVNIPKKKVLEDAMDSDSKLNCEKCGKTFKLKIMLKRHLETCETSPHKILMEKLDKSPQKELLVSLQPIDMLQARRLDCEICTTKFKTIDNLRKHMRVVHAAVLKRDRAEPKEEKENGLTTVPCLFCQKPFQDYYGHSEHFLKCPQKRSLESYSCPICHKVLSKINVYILHMKSMHFGERLLDEPMDESTSTPKAEFFECRMCSKRLASQELLITHLASHMSNMDNNAAVDDDSRASTPIDSISVNSSYSNTYGPKGTLNCSQCDKSFKYKKALETHELKHSTGEIDIKVEPPDKSASTSLLSESQLQLPRAENSESESSHDEAEDNTCDICEKQFSYRRLLLQHKRTKHNMSSGTKRAKITLKDCMVRCLICDIEMKVSAINEHNQKHITVNIKPRNMYTCGVVECAEKFKSCSALANHIKLIHRLKQQPKQSQKLPRLEGGSDLADFCEVVVTKTEPLDTLQSHNGFGEVPVTNGEQAAGPLVNMSGFTCTICGKVMGTLISLKRHINWHTNVGNNIEKMIECFVCKEKFRFQCHYKLHMREHYRDTNLDPKFLTCSICNRKSKHLRAAQAHMNFHKQTRFKNKDYQCSICKRVFQYRKVYLSHMAIHYKRGESVQNTIVGDVVPNNLDRNIFDGTHTCHLCKKVCDSETSLKHHIIWHKSKTSLFGARHECYVCQLVFTNKRRLELHIRSHYEDENGPYKCQICGKGYIDEEYFKRHVKGHNFDHQSHKKRIEKLRKDKVKCPICARYYPDLVKLIRHLRRTHPESKMIKEDPDAPPPIYYSCKLCAKVFMDERRLQHHEEAHLRKPEFFKCKFCGKKTISLKNHRIHIKGHLCEKHLDNPLQCPHCEETFIKGYGLHHHLRDAHGINETWIADRKEQTLDGPLKEFQCSICFKILASKGNFERHIDYHNSLRCNYCFEYFSTLRFLEGHLSFSCDKKKLIGDSEIYPKKVKCHVCYKAFHLQVKLDCHLRTQHNIKVNKEASSGRKDIVCDYCFRVFENEDALTTHKLYHRTIGYYGCLYCKRKFNTMTLYRKHKNYHYSQLNVDNPTKCEHCDETFVAFREMIYHMRDEHGDNKEWIVMPKESIEEKCPICNKIFYNLHKHLTYHEENRCKKCGEYFYSRIDYDNHLCAIESDDDGVEIVDGTFQPKYEECRFCFKPVTRKNSKRLHNQIHQVSGAISCRFCTLKFKTMEAFNIHAFSHRSRKYNKKPIKCRKCGEKFVKYGVFIKHMKNEHKSLKKMHYRAVVKAERCVVCGDDFPNLHNHYRAHLQNQCHGCNKYFTSYKLFSQHECGKEDADPSKVFTCDEDLVALINSYIPKDEKDDEKYYGYNDDEEEGEDEPFEENKSQHSQQSEPIDDEQEHKNVKFFTESQDEESQDERILHDMVQSPIISDVLSLYQKKEDNDCEIVNLTDDDSMDVDVSVPVITIDDD